VSVNLPLASVALIEKVNVEATVQVPDRRPEEDKVVPVGIVPLATE
jgi:hypothetical protein